jgi:hypothetical protein
MKYDVSPTERLGPGSPLSEAGFLNDMPRMLIQLKRPVEEVRLLIGAMRGIARYLDGLEDDKALLQVLEDVDEVTLWREGLSRESRKIFDRKIYD